MKKMLRRSHFAMRKTMGCILLAAMICLDALAQGGTKSPYSQYGIGVLSDISQGMNRGMNGVGIALRQGNQVNTINPASYSSVDSLTMIFDAGLTGQLTNFKEGATRENASAASFEYVVGSFRAWKNVGMSFGVLPLSSVGYEYSSTSRMAGSANTVTESFSGSGGLHQAFVGVGVRLLSPLSVGVNMAYLWGDINRTVATSSSSSANTLQKRYSASVKNYKLDVGVQWEQPVGKNDRLAAGVVFGLGHKLGSDPELAITSVNSLSGNTDTTTFKIDNGLELPHTLGAGLAYYHGQKLIVAADVQMQKWGAIDFPGYDGNSKSYELKSGLLKDRLSMNAGLQWTPNAQKRQLLNRIHYRLGAGFATPYYKINGQDGPKDLSVSFGFGIPITNGYNNRSLFNVSGQWVRSSAPGLITENTFRINVGLTFNERWFAKWRVE